MPYGLIVIALIIGLIVMYRCHDTSDKFFGFLLGSITSCAILLMITGTIVAYHAPRVTNEINSLKLIAVNDSSEITGSFWIGSGTINEQSYYYFYYQSRDRGIHQWKVPVNKAVIYENAKLTNHGELQVMKTTIKKPWNYWTINEPSYRYSLIVPTGTVIRQLKLDLK